MKDDSLCCTSLCFYAHSGEINKKKQTSGGGSGRSRDVVSYKVKHGSNTNSPTMAPLFPQPCQHNIVKGRNRLILAQV